jgi:hypothetical protein
MDCLHTNENRFEQKAINKNRVVNTWKGLLENEDKLPKDWISNPGVLVGIRLTQATEE